MIRHLVAFLIPVYNEGPVIKDTVRSLRKAGAELSHVYIANDGSTDDTLQHAVASGANVYAAPKNGGKAAVLKAAIANFRLTSRYRWVVFLDGDTKVAEDFVRQLYRTVSSKEYYRCHLIVGHVASVKDSTIYSASRAYDYMYSQLFVKAGQSNFRVVYVAPGCVSVYRSSMLRHLHLSNDTLSEDMDLTFQVHARGGSVRYVSNLIVHTQDPGTWKDFHKQTLRWYRGFWQVVQKHGVLRPHRARRVDWYIRYLILDSFLYNRVFGMLFLYSLGGARATALGVSADMSIAFLIAVWVGIRAGRLDVIWKFPAYYWFSYLSLYAFVRTFLEVIVLRKSAFSWNKVARRSFEL